MFASRERAGDRGSSASRAALAERHPPWSPTILASALRGPLAAFSRSRALASAPGLDPGGVRGGRKGQGGKAEGGGAGGGGGRRGRGGREIILLWRRNPRNIPAYAGG